MAYFRCGGNEKHYATIAVTTDYLFGETVTCTCADVGYSRTATFSDDGEAKFTVNDWGRYTITSGDHASIIDVSAWYVTYEVDFAGSKELNLTLEGAMNDTITIKDSTGATVGTCIFNNSTTGQTRITTPLTGGEYTFVSSVSKALDGSGADYSKTVTITQGSTTVRVLPDGALYWYGNESNNMIVESGRTEGGTDGSTSHTVNTNNIQAYVTGHKFTYSKYSNKVDITNYSIFHVIASVSNKTQHAFTFGALSQNALNNVNLNDRSSLIMTGVLYDPTTLNVETHLTADVSEISGEWYTGLMNWQSWGTNTSATVNLYALWLE